MENKSLTNYIQVVEQTQEEKIAIYMKCSKKELIEMLLENQRLVDLFRPRNSYETCKTVFIDYTKFKYNDNK
jgi:hypothetical protein